MFVMYFHSIFCKWQVAFRIFAAPVSFKHLFFYPTKNIRCESVTKVFLVEGGLYATIRPDLITATPEQRMVLFS